MNADGLRADEKPSDMAYQASLQAIEKSGLNPKDIGGIIVSTSTPDLIYPSTSCILQGKLGIRGVPCFDLTAACSGWLYGITVAKGLILAGVADNILVTSVELQSRVLDKKDRNTYFLFGDGAGATVVSGSKSGHVILNEIMLADSGGLHMARGRFPDTKYLRIQRESIRGFVWMVKHCSDLQQRASRKWYVNLLSKVTGNPDRCTLGCTSSGK